jgi:uncharacterized SAM-binding protein YcdF (DUF218 family)
LLDRRRTVCMADSVPSWTAAVGVRTQLRTRSRTNRAAERTNWAHYRFWRRALATTLVLLLAFAVATARIIVWPAQGMPSQVDAIVMLAGPGNRLPIALRLAAERRAPVLVVSLGRLGYGGPCPVASSAPKVKIICFDPDPANTRGEAEFAARLARRYGWRSVVLVTAAEQATRARIVIRRCYSGAVYVVTASQAWYEWPYQIAYGWGSLFKALLLEREC